MSLLTVINHSFLWNRRVKVGSFDMRACSGDRLLYLWLQKIGFMGGEERRFFQEHIKPGMTVVEAGGNIGVHTLVFSMLTGTSGKVFTFEPDPRLYATLCANLQTNAARNVVPNPSALGSQAGTLPLRTHGLNSGDTSLSLHSSGPANVLVKVVTMDETLPGQTVDFVKIDVQGWELEVLRGMVELLRANRKARVLFEFWPFGLRRAGFEPSDLLAFLAEEGWRPATLTGRPFTRDDAARWENGGSGYTNLTAIHADEGP